MPEAEAILTSTVAGIRWGELPESTRREAVRAVLDYLAAAVGGYRYGDIRLALERVVRATADGETSLVGNGRRTSLGEGVLFNASVGNGVELDDGQREGSVHAGSIVVPVALALGVSLGRSGPEVLEAIVAGYEVTARLGAAINPGALRRSFHTTGYCGPMGAAATAAKLLRLSEDGIRGALGTAGLLGAGFMESTRTGQVVKPIHVGRAADAGLLAARLAEAGAGGPLQVLSGPKGLGQAITDKVDWDRIARGSPYGRWEIESRYVKPYPTCRHAHPSIDLALQAHRERHPRAEDVRSVHVTTYSVAVRETGEIVAPATTADARFSLRYHVACALLRGKVTDEDLRPEALVDEAVLSVARRIEVASGPEHDAVYPRERGARMRIELADGSTALETRLPKGEPENPVTDAELEAKLRQCAGVGMSPSRIAELVEVTRSVPRSAVCPDLIAMLVVE